jgi:hypothetical protein
MTKISTIFNNINFDVKKTPESTVDFKILDTICDHRLIDEPIDKSRTSISGDIVWISGTNGNYISWSGVNTSSYITITTKFPLGDKISTEIYQNTESDFDNMIYETYIIPSGVVSPSITLTYPPKPNSVQAKYVITNTDEDGEQQTNYYDFINYTLYQLNGNIIFNNIYDGGSTIRFGYVSDIKQLNEKSKDGSSNWEFIGYNQKNQGIYKIYVKSLTSNDSYIYLRYTTALNYCPKCAGDGLINDFQVNNRNRYVMVYDFSKLIQDFFKRLLTKRGSNKYNIFDGTQIATMIGSAKNNIGLLETTFRTEVINLVNYLRKKQESQNKSQGISYSEQIQQINRLSVTRIDNTTVNMDIEVQSKSGSINQIKKNVN